MATADLATGRAGFDPPLRADLVAAIPASTPLCIAATNAGSSSAAQWLLWRTPFHIQQALGGSCFASSSIFSARNYVLAIKRMGHAYRRALPVLALSRKIRRFSTPSRPALAVWKLDPFSLNCRNGWSHAPVAACRFHKRQLPVIDRLADRVHHQALRIFRLQSPSASSSFASPDGYFHM